MGDFNDAVYAMVRHIPAGKVASYGQIARLIGQPRKARFVGYAMHTTPQPQEGDEKAVVIPSHRVVFKDGAICDGYAFGGPDVQRALLEAEGVVFTDESHVDMVACQWDGRWSVCEETDSEGEGVWGEDVPLAPPDDFDWDAELGDVE